MFRIHVTYKTDVEAEVTTDDEATAEGFFKVFAFYNPTVAEVTLSKMGKVGYRHVRTVTNATTTLPL